MKPGTPLQINNTKGQGQDYERLEKHYQIKQIVDLKCSHTVYCSAENLVSEFVCFFKIVFVSN
jgi:hypothetical protein